MNGEALNQVHQFQSTFTDLFPFQNVTRLKTGVADLFKLQIIQQPTSIHALKGISKYLGRANVWVKREDETSRYGYAGNKVRNLEYILADAQRNGAHLLTTVAPLGSNFVAALASHAHLIGAKVQVHHFIPQLTRQISAHAKFTEDMGAQLKLYDHAVIPRVMAVPAAIAATLAGRQPRSYFVSPGGSNALGAAGHTNAFFEFLDQVKNGEAPIPKTIIVGAGTCGTMAGFLAAAKIRGANIKIIGVRCVDALVCNRYKIADLANQVLKLCHSDLRVSANEVLLESPPGRSAAYGVHHEAASDVMSLFYNEEGIRLDSTYTSKVALFFSDYASKNPNENILYWHTYSGLKF
jgi:1-aminocyclopropane-1-carboxylate deaminase/D-cysteine desulfhydrase-like pyridoxal-dependent ACC family enzyme